jgi:hypothetical protein
MRTCNCKLCNGTGYHKERHFCRKVLAKLDVATPCPLCAFCDNPDHNSESNYYYTHCLGPTRAYRTTMNRPPLSPNWLEPGR